MRRSHELWGSTIFSLGRCADRALLRPRCHYEVVRRRTARPNQVACLPAPLDGGDGMTSRQLCASSAILTENMISQSLDQAFSAKLQRIGAVASLFEIGLERQTNQKPHGGDASDSALQAIADLAETLKTKIAEDHLTPA
jgi:hypothetical protein